VGTTKTHFQVNVNLFLTICAITMCILKEKLKLSYVFNYASSPFPLNVTLGRPKDKLVNFGPRSPQKNYFVLRQGQLSHWRKAENKGPGTPGKHHFDRVFAG